MNELSQDKEDKLKAFINVFVEHPILTTIMEDFDRLRYNKKLGGEQQCMLITGDAGCGKYSVISHYLSRTKINNTAREALHIPILVSEIFSKPSLDSTIIELLKDLGQFGNNHHSKRTVLTLQALTVKLIKHLISCGTELIIINESQRLIEFRSAQNRQEISDLLKYVNRKVKIPIVLVGMPSAEQIANEPQWSSKLAIKRKIPYFKLSQNPQIFVQFLMGLAQRMPLKIAPNFKDKKMVFALFSASSGCLSKLKLILNEALKLALVEDASTLTTQHLSKVYETYGFDDSNPFNLDIEELTACEVLKYSSYDIGAACDDEALIATTYTDKLPISQLLKK